MQPIQQWRWKKKEASIRKVSILGKKKVVNEIEALFHREGVPVLSFHAIMDKVDEKRSTLLGVLSSHPRLFQKVKTNEWRLIPDETANLEQICKEYGVDRER